MKSEGTLLRELTCISCPIGCHLELYQGPTDDEIVVKGNRCPRGEEYGKEEYLAPKRVVTCTCPTNSKVFPRIPVRTDKPLPKELINELLEKAYSTTVKLPAKRGQVILNDFHGTGVSLISALAMGKESVS
jgi:CxxC motif-containing protein